MIFHCYSSCVNVYTYSVFWSEGPSVAIGWVIRFRLTYGGGTASSLEIQDYLGHIVKIFGRTSRYIRAIIRSSRISYFSIDLMMFFSRYSFSTIMFSFGGSMYYMADPLHGFSVSSSALLALRGHILGYRLG